MMALYPVPQLMQCVRTVPNALWGTERLNRGYKGPIMLVRRSGNGALADCYSRADIVAHCSGSGGFIAAAYDQSGNGRHLAMEDNTKQPKIYDSVTGLLKSGSNLVMQFDGVDDVIGRTDMSGLPAGSPAITTIIASGTWTNIGVTWWSVGPDVVDGSGNCWYSGHGASDTTVFIGFRVGSRTFNCSSMLNPGYLVYRKAASGLAGDTSVRQNKATLTEATNNLPTQPQALPGPLDFAGATRLGAAVTGVQWAACTVITHGHWNAELVGSELAALEQYLERIRVH